MAGFVFIQVLYLLGLGRDFPPLVLGFYPIAPPLPSAYPSSRDLAWGASDFRSLWQTRPIAVILQEQSLRGFFLYTGRERLPLCCLTRGAWVLVLLDYVSGNPLKLK